MAAADGELRSCVFDPEDSPSHKPTLTPPSSSGNLSQMNGVPPMSSQQWYAPPPGEMYTAAPGPAYNAPPPPATFGRTASGSSISQSYENYDDEPPLLEELGINFGDIARRTKMVLQPFRQPDENLMTEADLAGPLVFCLCLGATLLLSGKVHFGAIYGYGASSCLLIYLLLNLLATNSIEFLTIASVLGYCLLPVIALALAAAAISLNGMVGYTLAAAIICWCTVTATRLFELVLGTTQQRFLIAYPVGLVYACFVLITIF